VSTNLLFCPSCRAKLRLSESLGAQKEICCPRCGNTFPAIAETHTLAQTAPPPTVHEPPTSDQTLNHVLEDSADNSGTDFLRPAEQPDELGRLGPYRVLQLLGQGGMGRVYRAEDPRLKRQIALKVMLSTFAADAQARQRFFREAQAQAALEHEHIVAIFEVDEDNGVPYLAMPLLKGETLADVLRCEGLLPRAEMLRIGREIAEGLAAAHACNLVHRDIKPSNIWLEGERRRVKILDFGLARPTAGQEQLALTQSGAMVGTPGFLAPEQARGGTVTTRSDLFSLGCVLYQMATGAPPFKGANMMALLTALAMDEPAPPQTLNPDVPPALGEYVLKLLAKDPAKRPPSACEVADRLASLATTTADTQSLPAQAAAPPAAPRWRLLASGLLVAMLAATACGVYFWPRPHDDTPRVTAPSPVDPHAALLAKILRRPPTLQDDFSKPKDSLFAPSLTHPQFSLRDSVYRIQFSKDESGQGQRIWYAKHDRKRVPLACQVVGRVLGGAGDRWALWLGGFGNTDRKGPPLWVEVSGAGVVTVNGHATFPEEERPGLPRTYRPAQLQPAPAWNTLQVVLTGDQLIVYINGNSVGPPIPLAPELPQATFGLGLMSDDVSRGAQAEFQRYTLWQLDPAPAPSPLDVTGFAEIHGADLDSLRHWLAALPPRFHLAALSTCTGSSPPSFSAIAVEEKRQFACSIHFLRKEEMPEHLNTMTEAGYRCSLSCPYTTASGNEFALVWVKDGFTGGIWYGDWPYIENRLKKARAAGRHVGHFSSEPTPQGMQYHICITEAGANRDFKKDLTPQELRDWLSSLHKDQRWRPESLFAAHEGKQTRLQAVVVENVEKMAWDFEMDLTAPSYEAALRTQRARGWRPAAVTAYLEGGEMRYAVAWQPYAPAKKEDSPH
jgi:serine/threonine protein kinase